MKPIQVEAGQHAPDVDEMIEKAGSMIEKIHMDNSQIRNITGVEEAPMNHFHTNQEVPSELEEITNKGASSENVTFINANPHNSGSTLDSHENQSGGDPDPPSSYTHSSVGKPPSDIKKEIEIILKKRCPCGEDGCKGCKEGMKKAGDPLAALLAGAGKGGPGGPDGPPGGPPMGDDGGPPPDGMPSGDDDEPSDPEGLASKINDLVDRLKEMAGPGDEGPPMGDELGGAGPPSAGAGGPPMAGGPPGM